MQGEAPALAPLPRGALAGGGTALGGRPARPAGSVITNSKALVESSTFSANLMVKPAQLDVERLQPLLAGRVEIGAVPAEVLDGFGEEAPALAFQTRGLFGGGEILHGAPKPGVERDAGIERR